MCVYYVYLFFFLLQDENSSVCNQKVDFLQKMLSREQQELQVSITIAVTYCSHSVFFLVGGGNSEVICTLCCTVIYI